MRSSSAENTSNETADGTLSITSACTSVDRNKITSATTMPRLSAVQNLRVHHTYVTREQYPRSGRWRVRGRFKEVNAKAFACLFFTDFPTEWRPALRCASASTRRFVDLSNGRMVEWSKVSTQGFLKANKRQLLINQPIVREALKVERDLFTAAAGGMSTATLPSSSSFFQVHSIASSRLQISSRGLFSKNSNLTRG